MFSSQKMLFVAASLFGLGLSQFVSAPTDLTNATGYMGIPVRYKAVPNGTCELTPGVKSYSGYIDVADEMHLFFWFFEARSQNASSAPLTVWLNGGPGSSSMLGLFSENGPCRINDKLEVINNPYSFNNNTNMLYIDQPAGTGLSYTQAVPGYSSYVASADYGAIVQLPNNSCPGYAAGTCGTWSSYNLSDTTNSTSSSAPYFYKGLQGFMGAFPQYARESFHLATESYGGHYGPVYSEYIQEQNQGIQNGSVSGAQTINLTSVLINNGWYDPLVQYAAYYNFTVYPGNTYDYSPFNTSVQEQMYNAMYGPGNCYDQTVACYETQQPSICQQSDIFCANEVEEVLDIYGDRNEYDIREKLQAYLNQAKVQKAIGAFVNFTESSEAVANSFETTGDDDTTQNAPVDVASLVNAGVYFAMYNGDADYNCNWLGNEVVADNVNASGWSNAGFENISTPDHVWHGQVKQSNNFAFARIFESGHEVPFYQPVAALALLDRVLSSTDLATGMKSIMYGGNDTSVGPTLSTYREGNKTIINKVLPSTAVYNTTTNEPNNPPSRFRKNKRIAPPMPVPLRTHW